MRFCPHCAKPIEDEPQLALASEPPRARNTDGPTARAAARNNLVRRGNQRFLVLQELVRFGPKTCEQISIATGRNYVSISPRISELREHRLIESTGTTRTTTSGQEAEVFRITDLGHEVYMQSLASPKPIDPTEVRAAA